MKTILLACPESDAKTRLTPEEKMASAVLAATLVREGHIPDLIIYPPSLRSTARRLQDAFGAAAKKQVSKSPDFGILPPDAPQDTPFHTLVRDALKEESMILVIGSPAGIGRLTDAFGPATNGEKPGLPDKAEILVYNAPDTRWAEAIHHTRFTRRIAP